MAQAKRGAVVPVWVCVVVKWRSDEVIDMCRAHARVHALALMWCCGGSGGKVSAAVAECSGAHTPCVGRG
eukprot:12540906-Alexandrium_andersonii.AAC.1